MWYVWVFEFGNAHKISNHKNTESLFYGRKKNSLSLTSFRNSNILIANRISFPTSLISNAQQQHTYKIYIYRVIWDLVIFTSCLQVCIKWLYDETYERYTYIKRTKHIYIYSQAHIHYHIRYNIHLVHGTP